MYIRFSSIKCAENVLAFSDSRHNQWDLCGFSGRKIDHRIQVFFVNQTLKRHILSSYYVAWCTRHESRLVRLDRGFVEEMKSLSIENRKSVCGQVVIDIASLARGSGFQSCNKWVNSASHPFSVGKTRSSWWTAGERCRIMHTTRSQIQHSGMKHAGGW